MRSFQQILNENNEKVSLEIETTRVSLYSFGSKEYEALAENGTVRKNLNTPLKKKKFNPIIEDVSVFPGTTKQSCPTDKKMLKGMSINLQQKLNSLPNENIGIFTISNIDNSCNSLQQDLISSSSQSSNQSLENNNTQNQIESQNTLVEEMNKKINFQQEEEFFSKKKKMSQVPQSASINNQNICLIDLAGSPKSFNLFDNVTVGFDSEWSKYYCEENNEESDIEIKEEKFSDILNDIKSANNFKQNN